MSLKTFAGFRGVAMHLELDGVRFYILAKDNNEAEALYDHIMPHDAAPFNPDACTKAILIEAKHLPERSGSARSKKKFTVEIQPDQPHDASNTNSSRES